MRMFKKFFFILIFFFLSISFLKAEDKVFYIDIDRVLTKSKAGNEILNTIKKKEELKINEFKLNDDNFKKEEKKILAKKNLISKEEFNKEMKTLQVKFQKYKEKKIKEIDDLKNKRNADIVNFLNLINPIIEKYMTENSIYMLIDKKNIFIASKEYDITNNLIELIDIQIKNIDIK